MTTSEGRFPRNPDLERRVVRDLHAQGIEVTPDEVHDTKELVVKVMRAKLSKGHPAVQWPKEKMLEWLREFGFVFPEDSADP